MVSFRKCERTEIRRLGTEPGKGVFGRRLRSEAEEVQRKLKKPDVAWEIRVWDVSSPAIFERCYLSEGEFAEANELPLRLFREGGRTVRDHWFFNGEVFRTTSLDLEPRDVRALVTAYLNRKSRQLQRVYALEAIGADNDIVGTPRERISQEIKVEVWKRDSGRCVKCQSQTNLEFDHIIPLAMGGSNSIRNLQLLCAPCNRSKGATLG